MMDPFGLKALRADLAATRRDLEETKQRSQRDLEDSQRQLKAVKRRVQTFQKLAGIHREIAAAKSDRLTADWPTTPLSADYIVRISQRPLRARSRQLYTEDDTGRRFIQMVDANVVGHNGIQFQARARGLDGQPDELANRALETAWNDWGRRKFCDTRGRQTWIGLCRQAIRGAGLDGEILALLDIGEGFGGPYRFSVRLLDPDLLDINRNDDLPGGAKIRLGIEYDAFGRTTAYHLRNANSFIEGDRTYEQPTRIPADRIVHHFVPELIGQSRGLPWMCAAMLRIRMLGGYEDAALVAARVGAAKVAMIESPGEDHDPDATDAAGNKIVDLEPGTTEYLDPGEKLVSWTPDYPRGEFKDFDKAILRRISSGLGVSYNSLANDLEGVNYSSIRQGVLDERESWKAIQGWFIEGFCFEIYRRWLFWQLFWAKTLLVPTSIGPQSLSSERQDKYEQVYWQPRRWSWVDPLNDQQANKEALKMRTTSVSRIIREQGEEPQEVWTELAADVTTLEAMGIPLSLDNAAPAPAQAEPGQPAEELGLVSPEEEETDNAA